MSKAKKHSAGLLMYRRQGQHYEVLLVHPGGPYWAKRDAGAWTLPKGQRDPGEDPLETAKREFKEETSFTPSPPYLPLGSIRQNSGKLVSAWAFEGDCDPKSLISNTCEIEWPPRSKKLVIIPEIDRGAWFTFPAAANFIREEQRPLLERLQPQLH